MKMFIERAMRRVAVIAVLCGAGPVQAADMTSRALPVPTLADVALIQPSRVHDWSGFHVDAFVDHGRGSDRVGIDPPLLVVGTLNPKGFGGGVGVGYDHQAGNFVVGIAADMALSAIRNRIERTVVIIPTTAAVRYDWFATVRPRAGLAFGDLLIYGTAGLVVGSIEDRVATPAHSLRDKSVRAGLAAGGGVEYALSREISVKAEYLRTDLATRTHHFGPSRRYSTTSVGVVDHLRAGLAYRF